MTPPACRRWQINTSTRTPWPGGEDLGFPLEAGQAIRIIREGLRQDLQRDVSVELGIAGAIHLAHAAFADLGDDGVRAEGSAGL